MSVDPRGGVWILDQSGPLLVHFDSLGRPDVRIEAQGEAPWEMRAPQAIVSDPAGGVWVADARSAKVIHFDSVGRHLETYASRAAISAVGLALAGERLLVSQRLLFSDRPALEPRRSVQFFVREAGRDADIGSAFVADTVTSDRITAAPFYGAPMIESYIAARPDGSFVTTYSQAYRLRWFSPTGELLREIQGCQGALDNSKLLAEASFERGMSWRNFASALAFGPDGRLVHLTTTTDGGFHRFDEFDQYGTLKRSALLPSKRYGGRFMSALLPTPSAARYWAFDQIGDAAFMVELGS